MEKLPIDTKRYLTLNGKTLSKEDVLLPFDLLITDFQWSVVNVLKDCFLSDTEVFCFCKGVWTKTCLEKISDCLEIEKMFVAKQSFLNKKCFCYDDVVEIISFLRGPNGCPWDRAQTSKAIRTNIIEEAYELVDAIDLNDTSKMIEETGDLLLQAVFVALMEADEGKFDRYDVYDGLSKKLISRHTHIFGCDSVSDGDGALSVWEANKQKEKSFSTFTQNLLDVPFGMPALMRAQKIGKRASKSGMDWQNAKDVVAKCMEEVGEVLQAVTAQNKTEIEMELGDLLFSISNLCRFLDVSAEVALNGATEKFVKRFQRVEEALLASGKTFENCSTEYLDDLWKEAKKSD